MDKEQRIIELEAEITQLKSENAKLKILNDWYLEQFRLAQHRRFGTSSEKTMLPDQLGLFNEAEVLTDEPETRQVAAHTRKKRKGKRDEFYEGLPTEKLFHSDSRPGLAGRAPRCFYERLNRKLQLYLWDLPWLGATYSPFSCFTSLPSTTRSLGE